MVFGKAIENATDGGRVEEGHWGSEDFLTFKELRTRQHDAIMIEYSKYSIMEVLGGGEGPNGEDDVAEDEGEEGPADEGRPDIDVVVALGDFVSKRTSDPPGEPQIYKIK